MTVTDAKENKIVIRSAATRNVLEKTDRILGQGKVRVQIEASSVPAPAYTDGSVITINAGMQPINGALINGFTTSDMMLVTALNYHELAHCMFMPRLDTQLVKDIRALGAFHTFNILQDQIDETRFVQLYDPAKSYFTSLVTSYMMKNDEYLENNYVLVAGRLFLPRALREKFKERFSRPKLIDDIDRLVAEYKTLAYPDDQKRMFDVVKELHKLINDMDVTNSGTPHDGITEGAPDAERSRQLASEKEDHGEDEEEDTSESQGTSDDEEDDAQASTDDPDDQGSEDSGDDAEAAPDADTDSSSSEAQDPVPEEPSQEEPDDRTLEDAIKDAFDQAQEDVEQEVEDRIDSVKDEESNYRVDQALDEHYRATPTPELLGVVERCKEEFRQAAEQHAPGWHTQQRQGKLNPRHYAKALRGNENVYRRWREGVHDALDFEVVFLLDRSSSMAGQSIEEACNSLWVLRRCFDDLDGIVTTLGFGSGDSLLSQRNDYASRDTIPQFRASGGTYVTNSIKEAKRILSVSRKPLKLCVIITDGGFSDPQQALDQIRVFTEPISIIGIGFDTSQWLAQRAVVHAERIDRATELVPVVQQLALRLADERLKKGMG